MSKIKIEILKIRDTQVWFVNNFEGDWNATDTSAPGKLPEQPKLQETGQRPKGLQEF